MVLVWLMSSRKEKNPLVMCSQPKWLIVRMIPS